MLGLLGLRIFEATSADIADLGEEHGHRVLRICGKGTKIVLVPLPPAVGRAIDQAVAVPSEFVAATAKGSPAPRPSPLRLLASSAGVVRLFDTPELGGEELAGVLASFSGPGVVLIDDAEIL